MLHVILLIVVTAGACSMPIMAAHPGAEGAWDDRKQPEEPEET